MNSQEDHVSAGSETNRDSMEAVKTSPDSTKPSSRRGGSQRRVKTGVTSPDAVGSCSGAVRVLRARGAVSCKTNESRNTSRKKNSQSLQDKRRRPAGSGCKNSPVIKVMVRKLRAKKASKNNLGTKLSKSEKGNKRPQSGASCVSPATLCKPEAKFEASSCEEKTEALKGSINNVSDPDDPLDEDPPFRDDLNDVIYTQETHMEKSRCRATSQKEVKKEESEIEEEDIKKEESTKSVDEAKDNTTPPRKRAKQQKDDKATRPPKRRKKPPVQYVRCEIEGCGTVLAHPRYLQHHIKYQHMLKKKYVCDHPACGRLFRLQKQLLRHAKHHTDQRDYICEFCARAFKSSHNLAVHRMIHTGEKPIQCEICGFTCRQKASLNWHMKKHDAEASYQFPCSICNKKFEKKDSVVAHKAKSHPEVLIAEAMAANGGSVISTTTSVPETVPVLTQPDTPSVGQEEEESGALTPLEQVVLPLAPQTQVDVPQAQFLKLPSHQVVTHQQQPPTLLHLTTATPTHLSGAHLIQLSTLPISTVTPMPVTDHHSTLITLSSVTTLASAASLAPPQQTMQWEREAQEEVEVPGEGELWDRVVVGGREMMWEDSEERRKEDEGIVWDREGERQILLQCAEVHGEGLL
ncbi:LOW QUALITY PROTEIN: E3 ubiquitin-protein ligase ZFP91-like [Notolabrus celidotus]|uniref:LOW QUALITY PROTEIN: E3 ubiquitin-protein ligase ZFP91-like n=1 Tax=Notolabrus celidotus TaxID=1203425 RepID=UPI0014901EEE|nr:LOW QUALITY PROTEIN: E3 ubiquitin-protein ligase ZFP91-like [Notolabrus celidotus]